MNSLGRILRDQSPAPHRPGEYARRAGTGADTARWQSSRTAAIHHRRNCNTAPGTWAQAALNVFRHFVDKQQHRRDKGRQAPGQLAVGRSAETARGLLAYSTKPIASAPAATAASTSASRARPQILIRVRAQPDSAFAF